MGCFAEWLWTTGDLWTTGRHDWRPEGTCASRCAERGTGLTRLSRAVYPHGYTAPTDPTGVIDAECEQGHTDRDGARRAGVLAGVSASSLRDSPDAARNVRSGGIVKVTPARLLPPIERLARDGLIEVETSGGAAAGATTYRMTTGRTLRAVAGPWWRSPATEYPQYPVAVGICMLARSTPWSSFGAATIAWRPSSPPIKSWRAGG